MLWKNEIWFCSNFFNWKLYACKHPLNKTFSFKKKNANRHLKLILVDYTAGKTKDCCKWDSFMNVLNISLRQKRISQFFLVKSKNWHFIHAELECLIFSKFISKAADEQLQLFGLFWFARAAVALLFLRKFFSKTSKFLYVFNFL